MTTTGKINDEWRTPQALFDRLHEEFEFTLDAAADEGNHLLPTWLGPGGLVHDAFMMSGTGHRVFCNPPFSRVADFAKWIASLRTYAVMLCPCTRVDQLWWHEHVIGVAAEVRCIRIPNPDPRYIGGRVEYVPPAGIKPSTANFASLAVVYRPWRCDETIMSSMEVVL